MTDSAPASASRSTLALSRREPWPWRRASGCTAEHGDLAGGAAGIRVLRRADRGEPDDLVAGAGDEQPVHALGRGREALAPGAGEGVGLEEGDDVVGDATGIRLAEHGRLHHADGGGVVGAGAAHAGVGERPGLGPWAWSWRVAVPVVVRGRPRQRPWKAGVRRSAKARRPSARSSLAQAGANAAS